MSAHTSGKWEVSTPIDKKTFTVWIKKHPYFDGPLVIATDLTEGDAHLIAASQEMLEALRLCERALEDRDTESQEFAAKNARAVIAKAKGGAL